MAHYAEIVDGVVERVIVADTKEWCETNLDGTWVQTSYNTHGGVHALGGTPLRANFAGIGYTYDPIADVFYAPQTFPSWILNTTSYLWKHQCLCLKMANFMFGMKKIKHGWS